MIKWLKKLIRKLIREEMENLSRKNSVAAAPISRGNTQGGSFFYLRKRSGSAYFSSQVSRLILENLRLLDGYYAKLRIYKTKAILEEAKTLEGSDIIELSPGNGCNLRIRKPYKVMTKIGQFGAFPVSWDKEKRIFTIDLTKNIGGGTRK